MHAWAEVCRLSQRAGSTSQSILWDQDYFMHSEFQCKQYNNTHKLLHIITRIYKARKKQSLSASCNYHMYWHGVLYIHTYIGTIKFSYVTLVLLEHFLLITVCVTPVGMRDEPLLSTIIVTRMSMENRTPSPHVLSLCHCFCWVCLYCHLILVQFCPISPVLVCPLSCFITFLSKSLCSIVCGVINSDSPPSLLYQVGRHDTTSRESAL